jgi:ATP-dependent Lon protease
MDYPTNRFIPVLPVRNTVIFPGTALPLRVGRAKSIAAVQRASATAKAGDWIITVAQKNETDRREPVVSDLYRVGTLARIEKVRGSAEDGFQLVVRGVARFKIDEYVERDGTESGQKDGKGDVKTGPYIEALGEVWKDYEDTDKKTIDALTQSLKVTARDILNLLPTDTSQLVELVDGLDDPILLTHLCSGNIEIPLDKKQELLEMVSVKTRALTLLGLMQSQKDALQVQSEIREKLTHKMGKGQREAILREQLRTIKEELGEGEGAGTAGGKDDYRKKIEDTKMPDDVLKVALDELKRLEAIGNASPESHVIRNYLDLLCAMPWSKASAHAEGSEIDLDYARKVLNEDHYGLDKIKKRILQHLAVMKLKKEGRGSILLLVGPPGVGKTSLGQSIAKALGRKYVRGSLGGVRDDAEIRGHRRTYIGAMPGRIVQGVKRAGENNPVFILDEIDKLSRSVQGDPAGALLEVLDPEQNATFLDHYLDVPFDLSKVFFIATANSLESIPGPLLDRMEVIDVTGYTSAEKLHIAKNHLIPKQAKDHGIPEGKLEISDEALLRIITHYTREAGVRDLQRAIAAICRGSTESVLQLPEGSAATAEAQKVRVELAQLDELLGPERYVHEVAERIAPPGVVTGLAWTPQGGEILFIEASLMPGNGKLILTGQLGDVMKESAQIALSLVRSKLSQVAPTFDFEKKDVHIHVPSGAIPKDGPSAGIAMLSTIASLFSGRSVNSKVAMTGEITLRGAVMPVGGIKEKVMAAHRAGIEKIILSKRNQRDLRDVPEEVKSALQFEFVETAAEVFRAALSLEVDSGPSLDSNTTTPRMVTRDVVVPL